MDKEGREEDSREERRERWIRKGGRRIDSIGETDREKRFVCNLPACVHFLCKCRYSCHTWSDKRACKSSNRDLCL